MFILVLYTLVFGFLNSLTINFLKLNLLVFLHYVILRITMMYGINWWQMFPNFFLNFSSFLCCKEMAIYAFLFMCLKCCHSVIFKTTTVSSF